LSWSLRRLLFGQVCHWFGLCRLLSFSFTKSVVVVFKCHTHTDIELFARRFHIAQNGNDISNRCLDCKLLMGAQIVFTGKQSVTDLPTKSFKLMTAVEKFSGSTRRRVEEIINLVKPFLLAF